MQPQSLCTMPNETSPNQLNNWHVDKLWKVAQNYTAANVSVDYLWHKYKDKWYWFDSENERIDYDKFLHHYQRCQEADLNYPILIFPGDKIADGVHRLIKAKLLGLKTISAIVFTSLPEVDFITKDN